MTLSSLEQYRKHIPQGTVLVREGEQDSQIFLPERGVLDIFIKGTKVASIDATTSPDFIGEVGAILGVPRTATVIAATDCTIICLPKFELEAVMRHAPSLGVKLVRSLCKKLSTSSAAFAEFHAAHSRIAATGDTGVSLRNYMKGFLYLLEQACDPASGITPHEVWNYFLTTNPWGLLHGDRELLENTGFGQQLP
ncbi:MAG: cyclic nucleotide-binding domain-containing protein [Desulfobacterota bacterium]|nr:cyclic nucleotide-binding domain-containing protein [Thermodesulfobacteriota bacterium]